MRRWSVSTLLLLCGLCFSVGAWAQLLPLDVGASLPSRFSIWKSIQTLPDITSTLAPEQAASSMLLASQEGRAQGLPHADAPLGKAGLHPYWASVTLENRSKEAQSWLLSFESPTQDSVHLWRQASTGWQAMAQVDAGKTDWGSGELFPVWRLSLAPGESLPLVMRIDGYNRMRFPLYLMRDEAFNSQQRKLASGIGFFMAIPLVVLLYVLTLMRIAEDKSVLMFSFMALGEWVGASWVSGMLHATLPWLDRWWCGWIGLSGYAVLLGVSCLHAKYFLRSAAAKPAQDALLTFMATLWLVVLPVLSFFKPEMGRYWLMLGGQLHAVILFLLAFTAWRKPGNIGRTLPGLIFLIVWTVYLASSASYGLYRWVQFPISYMLIIHFAQGSVVAALLGCAVSALLVYKHQLTQQVALQQSQQNQLYAAAHHDLWQPIQSIGLYSTALETANSNDRARYQSGITNAVAAVHSFMEGLREPNHAPREKDLDLDALLLPLVEEFRLLAAQKHCSLRMRLTGLTVHSDPALLQRIMRNLLTNALRYTLAGGGILLGVRRAEGKLWLMVYDNGIGMSPEQAQACFDAYTRFGDIQRVPEGMGIGLYSVKRMADQLGIQTRLLSKTDSGTAIGVSLSTADQPVAQIARDPQHT